MTIKYNCITVDGIIDLGRETVVGLAFVVVPHRRRIININTFEI